jgi:hypothetical protein
VNPPSTEEETHLAVIYSLPVAIIFSFKNPQRQWGKGLLKEKMFSH